MTSTVIFSSNVLPRLQEVPIYILIYLSYIVPKIELVVEISYRLTTDLLAKTLPKTQE